MRLLSVDHTGILKLVDIQTAQVLAKLSFPCTRPLSLRLLSSQLLLLLGAAIWLVEVSEESLSLVREIGVNGTVTQVVQYQESLYVFYQDKRVEQLVYNKDTSDYQRVKLNFPFRSRAHLRAVIPHQSSVMVLFRHAPPQLFDLGSCKSLWQGRNVSNDQLDLQVLMDDITGCFLANGQHFMSVTADRRVRIYDLKAKKRQPSKEYQLQSKEMLHHALHVESLGLLLVAFRSGLVHVYDSAKQMGVRATLKGSMGVINCIRVDQKAGVIISGGADRYLHLHDCQDFKEVAKINLKQKLLDVLVIDSSLDKELLEERIFEKKQTERQFRDPRLNRERLKALPRNTISLKYLQPKVTKKQQQ